MPRLARAQGQVAQAAARHAALQAELVAIKKDLDQTKSEANHAFQSLKNIEKPRI